MNKKLLAILWQSSWERLASRYYAFTGEKMILKNKSALGGKGKNKCVIHVMITSVKRKVML